MFLLCKQCTQEYPEEEWNNDIGFSLTTECLNITMKWFVISEMHFIKITGILDDNPSNPLSSSAFNC